MEIQKKTQSLNAYKRADLIIRLLYVEFTRGLYKKFHSQFARFINKFDGMHATANLYANLIEIKTQRSINHFKVIPY